MARSRVLVPLVMAAVFVAAAAPAPAATNHGGPLTGTWSGVLAGSPAKSQHITITVNANERGGTWKLNASCHGPLTLDSISGGYHHYLRKLAHGSRCAGGDIDCLKRVGANVYDAVTSHRGGAYGMGGTLRRVAGK